MPLLISTPCCLGLDLCLVRKLATNCEIGSLRIWDLRCLIAAAHLWLVSGHLNQKSYRHCEEGKRLTLHTFPTVDPAKYYMRIINSIEKMIIVVSLWMATRKGAVVMETRQQVSQADYFRRTRTYADTMLPALTTSPPVPPVCGTVSWSIRTRCLAFALKILNSIRPLANSSSSNPRTLFSSV